MYQECTWVHVAALELSGDVLCTIVGIAGAHLLMFPKGVIVAAPGAQPRL